MLSSAVILVFILGYCAIAFEQAIKINKAASALLTGVLCWVVFILSSADMQHVSKQLTTHLGELSGILFFLMGAMTIVELIDAHDGFVVITNKIKTQNAVKLVWIVGIITFFLSAVLDNLTTAIVMISLLRKLIQEKNTRLLFAGVVVIAANAGGAWSPIGDITTTMLWIGGQITSSNIITKLFIPSLVCAATPLIYLSFKLKGNLERPEIIANENKLTYTLFERNIVLYTGLASLIFVPVFKSVTHLPPFMGVLFGLGILWTVTEIIHRKKEEENKDALSVASALQKIDVPSILFFLGILMAITALQSMGLLTRLATLMQEQIGNTTAIVLSIGGLSAIVDNVPLVAATMGMYDVSSYPPDSYLWEFIAYCTGTGGSILIIGSAAGVAVMGMEKIDFFWYLKKIGWLAALGYIAGAIVYTVSESFF